MTKQRVRDTSHLLNQLLTSRPAYTERWLRHAKRTGGSVNQSAVAKVFDVYMFDSGEGSFLPLVSSRTGSPGPCRAPFLPRRR